MANDITTPKRRYDLMIGNGFMALIAYRWASTIIQEGGQKPSEHWGVLLSITVGFLLLLFLGDYLLWRLQIGKAIRSGLWASAILGPYAALVAGSELGHPVWSQVIGVGSSVLAFLLFYLLDQRTKTTDTQKAS